MNVTAENGAPRWTYAYEPFGAMRGETAHPGAQSNSMKFAGEYLDPTGLYHLRARQKVELGSGLPRSMERGIPDPASWNEEDLTPPLQLV